MNDTFGWSSNINKTFIIGLIGVTMILIGRYMFKRMFHNGTNKSTKILKGEPPVTLQLVEKINKTHNVVLMKFKLEHEAGEVLGLPIGNHIRFKTNINNKEVFRSYTPISIDYIDNSIDFIIKIYRKDEHEKFPQGGIMTQYLESLNAGDFVEVTGPYGKIHYMGQGKFQIDKTNQGKPYVDIVESNIVCMIAGGTGITPMLQVLRSIVIDPSDHTNIKLIFANNNLSDIILRDDFDELALEYTKFEVYHVLSQPPDNWNMGSGFINEDILRQKLPSPSKSPIILICGPPPMVTHVRKLLTNELNYDPSYVLTF